MGPNSKDLAIAWYMLQRILLRFTIPIGLETPNGDRFKALAKVRTMINDQALIMDPVVASLTWQATLDFQVIFEMATMSLVAEQNDDHDEWKWRTEATEYMSIALLSKLQHIVEFLDDAERE